MVRMEKRKSLVFFLDWQQVLRKYDKILRCTVYDAICDYQESGEVPRLEDYFAGEEIPEGLIDKALMAFNFIKEDIDRNNAKYEAICAKRREWAKKGGEAKAEKYKSKESDLAKTTLRQHKVDILPNGSKSALNENGNGNENGSENGKELVNININNITTTTNRVSPQNLNFSFFEFPEMDSQTMELKSNGDTINARAILNELLGRGADSENFVEELGGQEKAGKIFVAVMKDWRKRDIVEHESLADTISHLERQMRIQSNINNRKAKKNGNKSSKGTGAASSAPGAEARKAKGDVAGAGTPKACDYE